MESAQRPATRWLIPSHASIRSRHTRPRPLRHPNKINTRPACSPGMIDLRTTGAPDRKRALASALIQKRRTLAAFCYSPFWDDLQEQWGDVFDPRVRSPRRSQNSSQSSKTSLWVHCAASARPPAWHSETEGGNRFQAQWPKARTWAPSGETPQVEGCSRLVSPTPGDG